MFVSEYFYKISTDDGSFIKTNIVPLLNTRIKRFEPVSSQQKNITIPGNINKNNGIKTVKLGINFKLYINWSLDIKKQNIFIYIFLIWNYNYIK